MKKELITLGSGAHVFARQILGHSEDAADAVHDAFEIALKRPDAYDKSKGSLKSWFFQVVRNRCIDILRKRRPAEAVCEQLIDPNNTPEASLIESERATKMHAALSSLDANKREIIVLHDYLDLSYAEIGHTLGIAKGTVMSRLHRARLALKEALYYDTL